MIAQLSLLVACVGLSIAPAIRQNADVEVPRADMSFFETHVSSYHDYKGYKPNVGDRISKLWIGNPQSENYGVDTGILLTLSRPDGGEIRFYHNVSSNAWYNRVTPYGFFGDISWSSIAEFVNNYDELTKVTIVVGGHAFVPLGGSSSYIDGKDTNRGCTLVFKEPLVVSSMSSYSLFADDFLIPLDDTVYVEFATQKTSELNVSKSSYEELLKSFNSLQETYNSLLATYTELNKGYKPFKYADVSIAYVTPSKEYSYPGYHGFDDVNGLLYFSDFVSSIAHFTGVDEDELWKDTTHFCRVTLDFGDSGLPLANYPVYLQNSALSGYISFGIDGVTHSLSLDSEHPYGSLSSLFGGDFSSSSLNWVEYDWYKTQSNVVLGVNSGYAAGYSAASASASSTIDGLRTQYSELSRQYTDLLASYQHLTYDQIYQKGRSAGYTEGRNSVSSESNGFITLAGVLASIPITILNGFSGMVLWNTPITYIFVTFLFLAVILGVIKLFI